MDALIKRKFQEQEDAETGSSIDIGELLMMSHKKRMALLVKHIEQEKLQANTIKNQVNVQINEVGDGTRYGQLIKQLVMPESQNANHK